MTEGLLETDILSWTAELGFVHRNGADSATYKLRQPKLAEAIREALA